MASKPNKPRIRPHSPANKTATTTGYKAPAAYQRNFLFNSSTTTTKSVSSLRKKGTPGPRPIPKVFYTPSVKATIEYLVSKCTKEVGWLGLVEKVNNDYLVTDIYVPKQTVTATETDIEAEDMTALAMEIMDADKDPSKLIYWGHSHVNMRVGPSTQDENQIDEYLEHNQEFIRGIYNKQGASKVDVYDVQNETVYQNVDNEVFYSLEKENKEHLDALIKQNVIETVYTTTNYNNYYYGNLKGSNRGQQGRLNGSNRVQETRFDSPFQTTGFHPQDDDYLHSGIDSIVQPYMDTLDDPGDGIPEMSWSDLRLLQKSLEKKEVQLHELKDMVHEVDYEELKNTAAKMFKCKKTEVEEIALKVFEEETK